MSVAVMPASVIGKESKDHKPTPTTLPGSLPGMGSGVSKFLLCSYGIKPLSSGI